MGRRSRKCAETPEVLHRNFVTARYLPAQPVVVPVVPSPASSGVNIGEAGSRKP